MTVRSGFARHLAARLIKHAARMLPDGRASWGQAMEQQVHYIDGNPEALLWAAGCVLASYAEQLRAQFRPRPVTRRQAINRVCAIAPVVMSLIALLMVLIVVTTGWERHLKDEGAAAHIFQLMIVLQGPFVLAFLATATWNRTVTIALPLAFQVLAIGLAFGALAFFNP